MARLLQLGVIPPEALEQKYKNEIFANEFVLLSYYIASINIEQVYHQVRAEQGVDEGYVEFPGMTLTDTFQLHEGDGTITEDFAGLEYNDYVTLTGIPEQAQGYSISGRSPLEWIIDRYHVKTDKASGIVNNPNDFLREQGRPDAVVDLIKHLVTVSMRTQELLKTLPTLEIPEDTDRQQYQPTCRSADSCTPLFSHKAVKCPLFDAGTVTLPNFDERLDGAIHFRILLHRHVLFASKILLKLLLHAFIKLLDVLDGVFEHSMTIDQAKIGIKHRRVIVDN
ncbi:type ISP restriction/modification enzyme [uncultured Actinomyces sp.]|uniref:type ISP restriction/modification enzyme n=1 Tax=uncultured Actinomyces sp. TaxID=249061 RepID=UPI0028EDB820|nr:type ISP restriction/modification enzyme [uncultured Actinomyces sp.]